MRLNLFMLFVLLTCLYCMSCSPKLNPSNNISEVALYPKNADTARFQFLRAFSSSSDIEELSNFEKSIIGKRPEYYIGKPYGVSVNNNNIYVTDMSLPGINILDLNEKSLTPFKPLHKRISFVLTSATDNNGDLYVVDSKDPYVVIYNKNRKVIGEFEIPECGRPSRIRIKEDRIYISDLTTKNIYMYDKSTYKLLDRLIKEDAKADEDAFIYIPMDFDLTDEYFYVIDAGHYKVKIYNYNGDLIKSFGGQGLNWGLFNRPKTIAVDKEGNILVGDSSNNLVQIFNSEGQVLMAFGNPIEYEQDKFTPGILLPTSMVIDYNNLDYFKPYVNSKYNLKYVVYVVNQRGWGRLKVFGRIELK
ncbi:NHL repeat-containing protein [Aestuariivivens marinum]|uniref:hypothetical protein n=1 Tax=Aestuariivivens marinum TaxID=2913555 RepID=UPI001F5741B1|nr:hypothetical protein [Aestuariivivens marinum]